MTSFLVYAALTTPFADDGSVDVEAVSSHVELLVDDGVEGLVAAGTTGEGPLLEEHEVTSVVAAAVEAAAGRMEVIAHVGRASTAATVRLAADTRRAGADALIAVTPWYYAYGPDALLSHYRALMDAAGDTPAMAYAFPDRAGYPLPPEVLDTLAGEGLAGLKDSSKSPERLAEYLEVASRHAHLRTFVGAERLTLEALQGGAAGTISALANARGDVLLGVRDRQTEDAQRAVNAARDELPGIPEVKRAVSERLAQRGAAYPPAPRSPL